MFYIYAVMWAPSYCIGLCVPMWRKVHYVRVDMFVNVTICTCVYACVSMYVYVHRYTLQVCVYSSI